MGDKEQVRDVNDIFRRKIEEENREKLEGMFALFDEMSRGAFIWQNGAEAEGISQEENLKAENLEKKKQGIMKGT